MKAIHAYVRRGLAEQVIGALLSSGCGTFSVLDVRGIAHDAEPSELDYSVSLAQRVEHVVKIEIVARDEDAERWASVIAKAAHTGNRGDGLVSVLPVESAVRIATGDSGDSALAETPRSR
jgi:nitrogen regulatory protein PII